jgi:hypothetical protein
VSRRTPTKNDERPRRSTLLASGGAVADHPVGKPEAGGGRSGAKVGLKKSRRARRSRRASKASVISCGAGSCCASGASCGRPCGGPYLGVDWPYVLLRGFDKSRARRFHAISTGETKPYYITHSRFNLKGFTEPNFLAHLIIRSIEVLNGPPCIVPCDTPIPGRPTRVGSPPWAMALFASR